MPEASRFDATPWLTSCPCTQYATTGRPLGSAPRHCSTPSGERRIAPATRCSAVLNAGSRLTSSSSGALVVPSTFASSETEVADAIAMSLQTFQYDQAGKGPITNHLYSGRHERN